MYYKNLKYKLFYNEKLLQFRCRTYEYPRSVIASPRFLGRGNLFYIFIKIKYRSPRRKEHPPRDDIL